MNFFDGWPAWGVVMCMSTITSLLTEITSNTAISVLFQPIVARMVSIFIIINRVVIIYNLLSMVVEALGITLSCFMGKQLFLHKIKSLIILSYA